MSDPPSKSSHETTPLTQDHVNQENVNAQELPPLYNPPSAYTETEGAPPPPPKYKKTPRSVPYAPTTTTVVVPMEFHSKPAEVMCPNCNEPITTRVEHEASIMTWMLCCFVSSSVLRSNFTKDVIHYCPICQHLLGYYFRPCSSRIVKFVVLVVSIPIILKIISMANSHRYYG
uniref:LITAF domain-containing protein n=1 Tax=Acrobeloides nanus TaxID=290746 RepID=A0A914E087_9BILA